MRIRVGLSLALFFGGFSGVIVPHAFAQTTQDQAPRLFLDCQADCDIEFMRTELTWVNHVRDRTDADVHVLATGQDTGAGGEQITFQFIGLRGNEGQKTQLIYNGAPNETQDARRRGMLRIIRLGLVPYAMNTPLAEHLDVVYQAPPRPLQQPASTNVNDPWNFWVIRTEIDSEFEGESRSKTSAVEGSIYADRVTEDWKIRFGVNGDYSRERFVLSDGGTFSTINRRTEMNGSVVRSISGHWSSAVRGSVASNTFVNQQKRVSVESGIEWNFFPYAESTRRQLTFQYMLGANHFSYYRETLFLKMKESLASQTFLAGLAFAQPWGSADVSFEAANYLHDMSKYHFGLNGEVDIRVARGLTLAVNAEASRVHDQLYLQRGDATDQEILVRQRQLATSYQYELSIGMRYTFGSIFNNVVNPRFRVRDD